MKLIVYWAVLIALSFLLPQSSTTSFMLGSWFGISWALWYTDYFKEKN